MSPVRRTVRSVSLRDIKNRSPAAPVELRLPQIQKQVTPVVIFILFFISLSCIILMTDSQLKIMFERSKPTPAEVPKGPLGTSENFFFGKLPKKTHSSVIYQILPKFTENIKNTLFYE